MRRALSRDRLSAPSRSTSPSRSSISRSSPSSAGCSRSPPDREIRGATRRCPMPEVILANLPFLAAGLLVTLELTLLSMIGGTALGLAVAILRHLDLPVASRIAALYIGFIRGTPLLVVLLITYFA